MIQFIKIEKNQINILFIRIIYFEFVNSDSKIALLGRLDVTLHVFDLFNDAFNYGGLVLEQFWR